MSGLICAEALKLRTTRTFWALALVALSLVAIAAAAISVTSSFAPGDHPARQVLAIAGPAVTCALVLGVLTVTGEFRHGTITQALLITPRRTRLLVAKLIAAAAGGLVLGLLAFGEASAIVLPILSARHIASHADGGVIAGIVVGGGIATGLFAALGTGIGAAVRSQVGAIIAALGLLYVLEPLLSLVPGIDGVVQRFGLAGLASGASGTTGFPPGGHILGQVPAALILTAYALTFFIAGTLAFRRRDLTV
jgi:ABC-type transport system involved in multi-copper enzyme maturation permease subunit